MAFWVVGLVALVAAGALVLYVLREEAIERERIETDLHDGSTPTLAYVVPTGEDPVVVLAALHRAGYTAGVDSQGAHQVVLVKCPEAPEKCRAKIRAVIESAGITAPKVDTRPRPNVRFADES